tara:strand:- start:39 stop:1115 length:1077 start_codon:yes stop_codon:yes gene_type:complete
MANMNVRTPRFYVDRINYLLTRGVSDNQFYLNSDSGQLSTMTSGSVPELFDMRPLNQVVFDTSNNRTEHVVLSLDQNFGSYKTNFIAILNHNMSSASTNVRVSQSGTEGHITATDFASGTRLENLAEVIGVADSGIDSTDTNFNIIKPNSDGHMIITFDEFASSYIGIQFEGSENSDGTSTGVYFDNSDDLSIGCILIGEYYDMPVSPDLALKRNIIYDQQNIQESLGGQKFSNITNYGKRYISATNKSPFHTYTGNGARGVYGGRITYDMKFSYLGSDTLMPSTHNIQNQSDDTVVSDVWNYTHGGHIPFIFTQDGLATLPHSESDYLFARFAQNGLNMTQVAPDVFDVTMKIEEEF